MRCPPITIAAIAIAAMASGVQDFFVATPNLTGGGVSNANSSEAGNGYGY